MLTRLIGAAAAGAAALSAPGIALTIASERMIRPRVFYTGAWHPDPPDAVRWPHEEAAIFTPDGLELQGWFFPAAAAAAQRDFNEGPAPTLLFFHGTSYNASDMWVTPERAAAFKDFLHGVKANFLVFDYRGYGRNGGIPTEDGTYLDGAAALAWLYQREDVDPSRIFFYGFSLGTGIATELAVREECAGLILRAPFTSIRDLAIDRHPRLRALLLFAPWLPLTNYNTIAKIGRLRRPLLVMHGDADTTVPEYMGQRVYESAPEPKRYVAFPGSGHADVSAGLVVPPITQFIADVLKRDPAAADSGSAVSSVAG